MVPIITEIHESLPACWATRADKNTSAVAKTIVISRKENCSTDIFSLPIDAAELLLKNPPPKIFSKPVGLHIFLKN